MATKDVAPIQAVQKLGDLLAAFTLENQEWTLSAVRTHLGWDKATTLRFLRSAVALRLLERDSRDVYRLGVFTAELAAIYMSTQPGRRELLRSMEHIAAETGLTTQISVLDGDRVVVVASVEGSGALNAAVLLGSSLPLYASASGKAILSLMSDEDGKALLPKQLEAFTEQTVSDRRTLYQQVAKVRDDNLAAADSELARGLYSLAIPVPVGVWGAQPCAMGCAGPTPGKSDAQWARAREMLLGLATDGFTHHQL
jgi:DNA-binding IclR family transcriptional regulator